MDTIVVDARGVRQRLDRYLASLQRWGSRSQIQRLIAEGLVRLDGQRAKADTALKAEQTIEIEKPARSLVRVTAKPEAIPLTILFEDDYLLVIDKPPGLVVHPAAGHWSGTLVNALVHHWGGRPADLDELRPGVVHRLDKDTSGVLVIAKDADTLAKLSDQFRDRTVQKEYLAIVEGVPTPREGIIDLPLARHATDRKRMAVRTGGRAAVSAYEVLATDGRRSLVRVRPRTGRTHQIRVHLASLGCPIVGDRTYARGRESVRELPRQALHAAAIGFVHPRTGEPLRFEAPLPEDLAGAAAAIREKQS